MILFLLGVVTGSVTAVITTYILAALSISRDEAILRQDPIAEMLRDDHRD